MIERESRGECRNCVPLTLPPIGCARCASGAVIECSELGFSLLVRSKGTSRMRLCW